MVQLSTLGVKVEFKWSYNSSLVVGWMDLIALIDHKCCFDLNFTQTSHFNQSHLLSRFKLPIAFQQTTRPVPLIYTLDTEFYLCNNEKLFLMDPKEAKEGELDYKGSFSRGKYNVLTAGSWFEPRPSQTNDLNLNPESTDPL